MAITLDTRDLNVMRSGVGTFTVAAGKSLKIETTPDGEEILNSTVPAGKVWEVTVVVSLTETDA